MKRLFIAEKPDLAKVIAEALGGGRRQDGYFECGNDRVTWCVGHLLELVPPEAHNPSYAKWKVEDLPLKLRPHRYQPIERTAAQLKIVQALLQEVDEVVHAGDPDDEGQLLVDEVLWYSECTLPVKRVLINDLNANAARKALQGMKDNREFHGLSQKALARSVGDQLYGFNMSRAYTLAARAQGMDNVLSVGRVQTPILGLIVSRYLANQSHNAAFFFNVHANLNVKDQTLKTRYIVPENAPADDKGRITDEAFAQQVVADCQGAASTVSHHQIEDKTRSAPLPFALLDLQVKMSRDHDLDAEKTMAITQTLREKYRAITYNRSDCNYLSSEQAADVPATLDALSHAFPDWVGSLSDADRQRRGRAFDDSKISAHTGIIPTPKKLDLDEMTDDEAKVYRAIVAQYLAQFLPDEGFQVATVKFMVKQHEFGAKARQVTLPGWTALLGKSSDEEEAEEDISDAFSLIASLAVGQAGQCIEASYSKEKTRPLPLYTEASLLADLKRVAKYVKDDRIKKLLIDRDAGKVGESGGIGTPATRAAMLETLKKRGFYTVEKKKLIPTQLGVSFIQSLPEIASAPDMTALWHEQQRCIEDGGMSADDFLNELELFISEQIANVNVNSIQGCKREKSETSNRMDGKCPKCSGTMAITPKAFSCTACDFKIWGEIAKKKITKNHAEDILTRGKSQVINGFISKKETKFKARLVLNKETFKVEFEF
ncbi:DNA topoisomerase III [Chromobacterium amazonense]|uniref:DNA topoisomerase n=1 Tax=Chromobacterium amazonense TaxID=1382803 RepID=A0A2S9WYE4_9NEIS|nr:type IA DNA topoisomerase [Chromobacterium amazonense]PRP68485.1 DNA topoisomerase III [Chromobacterium amazonense]